MSLPTYAPRPAEGRRAPVVTTAIARFVSNIVTLPYYQMYRRTTLMPVLSIASSLEKQDRRAIIALKLETWRQQKLLEFKLVSVAGALLAAAVIGSLTWDHEKDVHWTGPTAWYCSLLLSFTAIMLSASQAIIFENIRASPDRVTLIQELQLVFRIEETSFASEDDSAQPSLAEQQSYDLGATSEGPYRRTGTENNPRAETQPPVASIRWSMVFVWQSSMMLLAYSIIWFLVGFIVYVTAPLYDGSPFAGRGQGAIIFLALTACAGFTFTTCSFLAYKNIQVNKNEI